MKVALARQAAQALDRARLYDALEDAEARVSFIAEASELLSSSLDYETTMSHLATLLVPHIADWCAVDVRDDDGEIKRIAVAHVDPAKVEWAWEIQRRFPPDPNAESGVPHVLRTGRAEFMPEIPPELIERAIERRPDLREIIDELGLRSAICVPLRGREAVLGALSLVTADSGRVFTQADLDHATAIADRAGAAIENAILYREAERRGDAARALSYVGDAVILVDATGFVRYWNRAAELLSGLDEREAVGLPAEAVVPGWTTMGEYVRPADAASGEIASSSTVPVTAAGRERWLSVAAVDFGDGRVYAMRDVTEEYAFERARSEFVATASHELRTPLAVVYAAVRTLLRTDVELGPEYEATFLTMIESETEQLSAIVDQILLAEQLDSRELQLERTSCDVRELARDVLVSASARKPESIELELRASEELPSAPCDEGKLRQVLVNLVENAIKYSPDGGAVTVELRTRNGRMQINVSDHGLGIPQADQRRVFQKFVRLDPALARGVGGTGLGLYIAGELTERMGGTISLASEPGEGSTFTVELPLAVAS
jgi:PAS domain S-box-containing protein